MQVSLFALNISEVLPSFSSLSSSTLTNLHPAESILNGTLAFDVACQNEAFVSGLHGTFAALVSAPRRSLKQLLRYQYKDNLPIVNSKVRVHEMHFLVCLSLWNLYTILSLPNRERLLHFHGTSFFPHNFISTRYFSQLMDSSRTGKYPKKLVNF